MTKRLGILSVLLLSLCFFLIAGWAENPAKSPAPHAFKLDAGDKDYLPLLSGPPETVTMHSGLVTLAPGKSVGLHSTKGNEEMVIVLEGEGEYRVTGGPALKVSAGMALYCPPNFEHDMVNTGKTRLRYVYVVAKAG